MRFRVFALLLCAALGPFSSAEVSPLFSGEVVTLEQALDRIEQTTGREYETGDFRHVLLYLNTKDLEADRILDAMAQAMRARWSSDPMTSDAILLPFNTSQGPPPEQIQKVESVIASLVPLEAVLPRLDEQAARRVHSLATELQSKERQIRLGRNLKPPSEELKQYAWQTPEGRYARKMLAAIPPEDIAALRPNTRAIYGTIAEPGVRSIPPIPGGPTAEEIEAAYQADRRLSLISTDYPGVHVNDDLWEHGRPVLLLEARSESGVVKPRVGLMLPGRDVEYEYRLPELDFRLLQSESEVPRVDFRSLTIEAPAVKEALERFQEYDPREVNLAPISNWPNGGSFEHVFFGLIGLYYDEFAAQVGAPLVSVAGGRKWVRQDDLWLGVTESRGQMLIDAVDPATVASLAERAINGEIIKPEDMIATFATPTGAVSSLAEPFAAVYAPYFRSDRDLLGFVTTPNFAPSHADRTLFFLMLRDRLESLSPDEHLTLDDLQPRELSQLRRLIDDYPLNFLPPDIEAVIESAEISLKQPDTRPRVLMADNVDGQLQYRLMLRVENQQLLNKGYFSLQELEVPLEHLRGFNQFVVADHAAGRIKVGVGDEAVYFRYFWLDVPEPGVTLSLEEVLELGKP
jgi:hypothetical protein